MSALLLLASGGVACTIARRRMRHVMDGISADLANINKDGDLTRLSQARSGEIARLVQNLNNTLDRCDRLRWFASDLSHELRTPLTALRAELEEAELHPDQTDVRHLVSRSLRNLNRTQAVVTDMLLLARVQASKEADRERFDLGQLVTEEVETRMDPVPVGLRLEQGVMVRAVREQIRQVVINLLDNAQRHAHHRVEVTVRRHGDQAEMLVDDDGEGVPEADRQRIFERFTRLEEGRRWDQGTTGLGLAIGCAIAQVHGGGIHVDESPLGGARFVFRQPAA